MEIRRTYRFRLIPTHSQRMSFRRIAGARRWVWNEALSLQKARLEAGLGAMHKYGLSRLLTHWRSCEETSWLAEIPRNTSECALNDLHKAFEAFFEGTHSFPAYKKRGKEESFRFRDRRCLCIDRANGRVRLPRVGWVRYRKSRDVGGEVRTMTIKRRTGHWFVCITTLEDVGEPEHPSDTAVGLDLGVTRFATLSDGDFYEPLNALRRKERLLKRRQRQLSRKKRGSNNWKKQKRQVARLHRRIADARKDFLHKVSTAISKNHAVVVLEDLKVGDMSRSVSGKGHNAKAGLNRAILDQGWGEFRRMLEYKQRERGGEVVVVNPAHTSQRCSECGHVSSDNRKSQSRFSCLECGHSENADLNASKNILAAGLAATACGGQPEVGAPEKQEPARTGVEA